MKFITVLFTLLFSFSFFQAYAQEDCIVNQEFYIDGIQEVNPWTSLEMNNKQCQFQFAIVTDRTGGHRPGVFEDGVNKLNLLQPEFVMSVGDLIEGYTEDTIELVRQWNEFDGFVNKLDMPFFYVPGNHDITNQVMEDLYKERFGRTYYHFIYKDILFLCLNSEDQRRGSNRGTISDEQFEYVKKVLNQNQQVKWTLVFMHQPLWILEDTKRWPDVEQLLSSRKHTVFVGHHHHYVKYERNNGKYFMLATTGGGSGLRGARFGQFDHVLWVTMTEDGPILANLFLDGIWDENVVTEKSYSFIEALSKGNAVSVEPMYTGVSTFLGGKMRVRLTNDENIPMKATLKEGFSWDLYGDLDTNYVELPPNSVRDIWLNLDPRKQILVKDLDPITLTTELSFDLDDQKGITIPVKLNVKPLPQTFLRKAEGDIEIDGNLDEWKSLGGQVLGNDANDMKARYDLAYDEDFLYVAVEVTDDRVFTDTSEAVWYQDCISFVMSNKNPAKAAMSRGERWYRNEIIFRVTPEYQNMPSKVYTETPLPATTQWKCISTPTGYQMELAIPTSMIEATQGKDWRGIRYNLFIDDRDVQEERSERFWRFPNWSSRENYVGSGMIWKE